MHESTNNLQYQLTETKLIIIAVTNVDNWCLQVRFARKWWKLRRKRRLCNRSWMNLDNSCLRWGFT